MATLFLDDDKERIKKIKASVPYTITVVTTAEDCIKKLQEEEWDLIFLDHDLGGETYVDSNRKDCGMEVVRWIAANEPIIRNIIVHTHYGEAGETMVQILKKHKYKANYIPFNQLIKQLSGDKK